MADPEHRTFNFQEFFSRAGVRMSYAARQVIFAQGDPAQCIFYMVEGRVKMNVFSPQGKEAVIALMGPGDFFGESCLGGQEWRPTSATAMTDVAVLSFEAATMTRLMHERTEIAEEFIVHMISRGMRAEEDLIDHLFNSSEKRLARLLLILADFAKEGPRDAVIRKISQETLAEMVGTTRSRVSHFMSKFRRLGYINYNGNIKVHNSLVNVLLHDHVGDGDETVAD